MEEALRNLGTFAFVASHLFSAGRRHSSAVAEILCLIERLEYLPTEVQGMISSPHIATTLLFDVLRRWSLYLNRCVAASASESLDAPGCQVPFSLEPILAELEIGRHVSPILLLALGELVSRPNWRGGGGGGSSGGGGSYGGSSGGNGGGDGGATANKSKYSATGGGARVRVRYDSNLLALSLQDRESTRSILVGMVLPNLHGAVLC